MVMKFLGASELLQGRTDSNLGMIVSKSLILKQFFCYVTYKGILSACLLKRTVFSEAASRILLFFYHIRILTINFFL